MIKQLPYKDSNINYKIQGKSKTKTVVLLHGYLESLEIWAEFAQELEKEFKIIRIDLPGHGQSGIYGNTHTMDFMAETVKAVIEEEKIDKCYMFGHSLGGYATLAFLENYPQKLSGFSLFHSHPFADTPETIANRNREIELVKQGKKDLIFHVNIPKAFANDNIEKLKYKIEQATRIASLTPDAGIIAVLEGMKRRPDQSEVLKQTTIPFLYVIGKKDNYIPFDMLSRIDMPEHAETLILENSGHMGFFEERELCAKKIIEFINKY